MLYLTFYTCERSRNGKNKELHFQVGFNNDLVKVYDNNDLILNEKLTTEPQSALAHVLKFNSRYNKISIVINSDSIFFNTKSFDYHVISFNRLTNKIWYDYYETNDSLIYD